MQEVVLRWLDVAGTLHTGDLADLDMALGDDAKWLWGDVTDPQPATMEKLRDRFALHELAIEDIEHPQQRAKMDIYPEGLFLVWLTPERPEGDGIIASELDIFIGKRYLVTVHSGPSAAIKTVASDCERCMQGGPDWVLHKIVDLLVDSVLPLVDGIGEDLSTIEDDIIAVYRPEDLNRLHGVRRQLVRLHRVVAPERDMLRALVRESEVVSQDAYRYFQDVGDHLARVLDSIETYQDVGASVMDVFLSAQNNRMNEIMKQLTVVATIFMPLTLISGIYGMNVVLGMWPPINRFWSFPAIVAGMLLIAGVMAAYFRRKNWW